MISFLRFCEKFIQFDSQAARGRGDAPSVAGADVMKKPSQVKTAMIGDLTSFSGNESVLLKSVKIPFIIKVKKINDLYTIIIKTKGDKKYMLLSKTGLGKRTQCEFSDKQDAQNAAQDLIYRISLVDLTR
jgi:hypothetical protein